MNDSLDNIIKQKIQSLSHISFGLYPDVAKALQESINSGKLAKVMESYRNDMAATFVGMKVLNDKYRSLNESITQGFNFPAEIRAQYAKIVSPNLHLNLPNISKIRFNSIPSQVLENMRQVMQMPRMFQSDQFAALASRIQIETAFRQCALQEVRRYIAAADNKSDPPPSEEEVLTTIQTGIDESGLCHESGNSETASKKFFCWLAVQNPDLKAAIIQILIIIIGLNIEYHSGLFANPSSPSDSMSNKDQIALIHRIAAQVEKESNIAREHQQLIRLVSKPNLPVFRSNRRDSERVAMLSIGQVVSIKWIKKNWCCVAWLDAATGEQRTGWTLTRYLERL